MWRESGICDKRGERISGGKVFTGEEGGKRR
jgi:hypothetical protein